jgi:dTDP-glucose 4,6-dehydratase
MDISKARETLDWRPQIEFKVGLEKTVSWYIANKKWWSPILTGDYMRFYDEWYKDRVTD